MNAEIRELPEYNVAYVRRVGPYSKETYQPAFGELMQWAGPREHIGPGKALAIYWDNPDVTPSEKCRFDACIIIPDEKTPEGQVYIQIINGGSYMQYVILRLNLMAFN